MSNLTGGVVNDLTTAMVAMLAIGVIVMGFDYLRDLFEDHIAGIQRNRAIDDARRYKATAENEYVDPVIRDVNRAKYRAAVRRAAQ